MKRISVVLLFTLAASCGPAHIKPYQSRSRDYEVPAAQGATTEQASHGSLVRQEGPSNNLFTDQRAYRKYDVVIVKVEEVADAKRQADVDLSRRSSTNQVISALPFLGRFERPNPRIDLPAETKAAGSGDDTFQGSGSTGRSERFIATVPASVKQVLPNGNLFVEGHRVILVNEEEHHFYVSGVVRPIDIDQDNSIRSSQIADAEIEFVGRGTVTDNNEQGWFQRIVQWLRPF